MAAEDKKISGLPDATIPLNDADLMEVVQGGVNKKAPKNAVSTGGGGTVTSVTGTASRITSSGGAAPVIDIDAAYDAAVTAVINAKVADAINDGTTTIAPSQNAVFDALALKSPIASPTFTGTPAAPTASLGTNTTQLATTAFVQAAISGAKTFVIAVTDEVSNIAAGTAQVTFRMPYAMTLTAVRASLKVAQASGSIFTVDINEAGTTILSTKLTIDNTATTSVGAATPAVISDTALADDAIITIDVDQIGNGSAIGLKITLIGT